MDEALFFRLLKTEDKEAALQAGVRSVREGAAEIAAYRVAQETFRMIPSAPFAYWVSDALRAKFKEFPALEAGSARTARLGAHGSDDFRWVRLWSEIPYWNRSRNATWAPLAKGGGFSPHYSDIHLVVDWDTYVGSFRGFLGRPGRMIPRLESADMYFRPGLTWPRRTQGGLSVRVMPAGCVFADKGPAIFVDGHGSLDFLLGLLNSLPGRALIDLQMAFGSFEVGVIQRLPVPGSTSPDAQRVATAARGVHDLKRSLDTATENSHAFVLPAALQRKAETLEGRLIAWNRAVKDAAVRIEVAQREIDDACYQLYAIADGDRQTIEAEMGTQIRGLPEPLSDVQAAADLISWMVGVVFGRFDARFATGQRPLPELPDAFAPLSAHSPGMLVEGPTAHGYPVDVDEDGIIVEDEGHPDDVVTKLRGVLQLIWKDHADAVEREACTMLGTRSLQDYFARLGKGGFWDDHFRRYSKSRRRAPIYWPLQSPRGLYRFWIFYHRLTHDTVPKLLGDRYLGGKVNQVRHAIQELRPGGKAKPGMTKKEEHRLSELDDLLVDLEEFAARIRTVVQRTNDRGETVGYAPSLNDGVVLCAAPLYDLIPWPKARKYQGRSISELLAYWEELSSGEYEWSHIAMLYWPTRVTAACRRDKSLAIAHGLDEELFPGLRDELHRAASTPVETDVSEDETEGADEGEDDSE